MINALRFKEFGNYWFETGTPSFLVELLKTSEYDLRKLEGDEVDSSVLGCIESYTDNPIPMIYQSSYEIIGDMESLSPLPPQELPVSLRQTINL